MRKLVGTAVMLLAWPVAMIAIVLIGAYELLDPILGKLPPPDRRSKHVKAVMATHYWAHNLTRRKKNGT